MKQHSNHQYAIFKHNGTRVFIDDVPNGKRCGCICSKCKEPLIARNGGEIKIHHFAHLIDSSCLGETLVHFEAKEIIKRNKYLYFPNDNDDLIQQKFDNVSIETRIKDSNYVADIICSKNSTELVVEIEVTHGLEPEKLRFLTENKISTLVIQLNTIEEYNDLPDNFENIVLKESERYWIVNEKRDKKIKERWEREKKEREEERKKQERIEQITRELERYEQNKRDQESRNEMLTRRKQILPILQAIKEIWLKNDNKLFYGKLVTKNLSKYGSKYPATVCVESDRLPTIIENIAIVRIQHQKVFRPYIGKRVGFKIYYEFHEACDYYEMSTEIFPHCIILWMDGKSKDELENIRDREWGRQYMHYLNEDPEDILLHFELTTEKEIETELKKKIKHIIKLF